jgi:hypothetical protein
VLLFEARGKRTGTGTVVPIKTTRNDQSLRRLQSEAVHVGDERMQRRELLASPGQREFAGLLDGIDGVSAGAGEGNNLCLRALRTQEQRRKIGCIQWMPCAAEDLASMILDDLARGALKIVTESIVRGQKVPGAKTLVDQRGSRTTGKRVGVVGPMRDIG